MEEMLNPVAADAFVGIDPEETTTVTYGKGKFTVGVLPIGLWDRLMARATTLFQTTRRVVIRRLADAGEDPERVLIKGEDGRRDLLLADVETQKDDAYRAQMNLIRTDAVKYGLRGHEKVITKRGSTVPFTTVDETVDGFALKAVSQDTLKFYRVNPMLMEVVWHALRDLHDLSPEAKKA